jgi:hypothetical protein
MTTTNEEEHQKQMAEYEKTIEMYWSKTMDYAHNELNKSIQTLNETGSYSLKILVTLSSTFLIGYFYASEGLRSEILTGLPYLFYSFTFAILTLLFNYFSYMFIVPIWQNELEKSRKREEPDRNSFTYKIQKYLKNTSISLGVLTGTFLIIGLAHIFKSVTDWTWLKIFTFGLC